MLREGSPRFPGRGVQADACALPLRGASFDVVVNGFGMRNLPDAQLGAREVLRVLKPGGRVLFLLINTVFTKVTGKKVDPKYEGYLHAGAMVLLLGLMAVLMIKDVLMIINL